MSAQFELEQQLLDCWKVTDDIQLVYKHVMEADVLDRDRIANILLGMKELYTMKFEQQWETFELLVGEIHEAKKLH